MIITVLITFVLVFVISIITAINPKLGVWKRDRNNPSKLKTARIISIAGIIFCVLQGIGLLVVYAYVMLW